jgi:hypothetical protein
VNLGLPSAVCLLQKHSQGVSLQGAFLAIVRIITALDLLQVRAEGFGRSQVLNGVTEGFGRCCEPSIRRYLVRQPSAGFARNSSAGAL